MRANTFTSLLTKSGLVASVLFLASGAAFAQQQINLSAGPTSTTLPDGTNVPMWGYSCGTVVSGSTATCASLDAAAPTGFWSPVVVTVPAGQDLQINLTNNLSFTTTTGTNNIPTSLVIVGQLGGGLGATATYRASPVHAPQGTTWPIAGDTNGATFNPPAQGQRVESFTTEALVGATLPTSLTWTGLRPGTYLIESGTHPSIQGPMGLYGILVVTCAPTDTSGTCTPGTAYPGVTYNAEVPLLLSEIDPVQNAAVQAAVSTAGFSETAVNVLRDQVGSVVPAVDANGNVINAGTGYHVGDPVLITGGGGSGATAQVATVSSTGAILTVTVTSSGSGYSSTPSASAGGSGSGAVLSAGLALSANTMAHCSDGVNTVAACYPPAVNYTPLYYLVNGAAFDKTHASSSLFAAVPGTSTAPVTGSVLVRLVNAGLRMHVPSIVGSQTTPFVVPTGTTPAAVPGFSLVAEDGNPLPGVSRVQSEVFMPAGKTYDVMVNVPATGGSALPIFDRELSLSADAFGRDGGMLAYIGVNGSSAPSAGGGGAVANADTYNSLLAGKTFAVSDPSKGVIANDVNVYGVTLLSQAGSGTVTLNKDGTFTYVPTGTATSDSFTYCANGSVTGSTCSSGISATVTLGAATIEGASGITCTVPAAPPATYSSNVATTLTVKPPGILTFCRDAAGYPLTVNAASVTSAGFTSLSVDANGGFIANVPAAGNYSFSFKPQNAQGTVAASAATVTLFFPAATGLAVTVLDGADKTTTLSDYRWIIEEDRTFFVDPNCTKNPLPAGCPAATPQGAPAVFGTNFHTSYMPIVAKGCTGPLSCEGGQTLLGAPAVCDVGNGVCRTSSTQEAALDPGQVALDPTKRYYISVLPGDAADPFNAGYAGPPDCSVAGNCGHGMGGAPIAALVKCVNSTCAATANPTLTCTFTAPATSCIPAGATEAPVKVLTQPSPYPPAKLTVFVFEDDYPLNGEHDAGGGIDVISPQEPGLGGFEITLFDDAGGTGDATGQPTFDMFNMPLTNSLAGTIDPVTGLDACPISPVVTANTTTGDGTQKGIIGMIVTCPTYESDNTTLSPLAGQAVVNNLYQGRYGVVATPGADRIARGEEWLQTNTLDGQKAHDSFMRIGEPAYFQEYGPAGYHVTIGFANPKVINDRKPGICPSAAACPYEVKGHVTTARMSRVPDERLYGSGSRDIFAFTQCYASLGDPDGADFAFSKCDADGNYDFTGIPAGNWKVTIFDQWNDQIVDGIMQPVAVTGTNPVVDMGEIAVHQWQANIYTRTFVDNNFNGVSDKDANGNDTEAGLALVSTNIRFRDGSYSNFNNTDLNGYAGFNEVFPLFSWYVIETDSTRYKTTGVHVVYDAGGAVDGSSPGGTSCATSSTTSPNPNVAQCGTSSIANHLANTYESYPLPANLSVPGAVYCAEGADCATSSATYAQGSTIPSSTSGHSTGRIDPPYWFGSYGWQGFIGQNSFLEFGKKPYAPGETGGIHGHVVYASTRPFDDPQLLLQLSWEPLVPHVRVNLYKEDFAADGVTPVLTLVDHTETSSFDDWAQGFRRDASGNIVKDSQGNAIPNMSCPGQSALDSNGKAIDPFFFSLQNQPEWLDFYNNGAAHNSLPYSSQYKCYDGMHNWNQLQPAPYDGMYSFPSVTALDPVTGKPAATNCTGCVPNPSSAIQTDPTYDPYRAATPMLPPGKYVVEVVVPPGYELVKEEDKNILIGDNYIAPVTTQFGGLGNIFIMPDQAEIAALYNSYNAQNPTQNLGRVSGLPSHEGDTGSVESFWPCVGAMRTVPDYISLFPGSAEVSPFAGATRPLCDRKEITLADQSSALAKFYVFTPTHVASHYTGLITDDFTAEFDPFSPAFGEKFAPAYLPVSVKDWAGNETSRTYSDQWGAYNGLSYSTWEVNPPNPTGYGPTMMVVCMNDAGTGTTPDPLFQPAYSQFCYELPFMPGQTGYFDTPVVPNSSFAEGYNHPDCNYADATPAISEVDGTGIGPWVSAPGGTLTIKALGNQNLDWYGYSGPATTTAPFNNEKVTRHYGFGTQSTGTQCNPGQSCAALLATDGSGASITLNYSAANWTDTQIVARVPNSIATNSHFACPVAQQAQYGGSAARCGQLVITAANGKKSVDMVTVTVGGKAPTRLAAGQTIQSAIDAAAPGDLIIVPPGVYKELVLMWKPVRLQGVGAASAIIDGNPHPAGKLEPWRKRVVCLFGLTPDGRPNPSDPSCTAGWNFASGGPDFPTMIVDRVPAEGILGWDATLNGNLAEMLLEPSLMGAYEGAAITVMGKGVKIPAGSPDAWGTGTEAAFPPGSVLLTNANPSPTATGMTDCSWGRSGPPSGAPPTPYPTNFYCNPSSIDGLGMTDSSQGGGGIFAHAWAHKIQIANNRVYSNTGTLGGGITIGQGEHIDLPQGGAAYATAIPPGSCEPPSTQFPASNTDNLGLPYCYNYAVNIHNNSVTLNSSMGDELFSSTPAGAGGVSISNGADYYRFTNNWVCGNLSTGDGGGVSHIGWSKNGRIEGNDILFNQSTNPTISTNGGGLLVMGAPDPDPACANNNDKDCVPSPGSIGPSDGTGLGLVINANRIMGNAADSGSGGGLRLQHVNGADVINFPNGGGPSSTGCSQDLGNCVWNSVKVTNNIIVNNVAGWDGAGISLQDALAVNLINNTIASNDTTASAGVLFGSLFAPLASAPGQNCTTNNGTFSCPQVAGLVSVTNSPVLQANLPTTGFSCPPGHGTGGSCRYYSVPLVYNNMIWQNRSFDIGVGNLGTGTQNQQKVVTLYDAFTTTPAPSQPQTDAVATTANSHVITGGTGACVSPVSYWDLGVRGDTGPTNHVVVNGTTLRLFPNWSVLTSTAGGYTGANNTTGNPRPIFQYCNGSRVPPELGSMGYQVPPGTNETNVPVPVFSLTPSATVDEGNNWINLRWGPLAVTHPVTGATLGNYGPATGSGSSAINLVPSTATTAYSLAPTTDFYGNPRKVGNNAVDAGAVEAQ